MEKHKSLLVKSAGPERDEEVHDQGIDREMVSALSFLFHEEAQAGRENRNPGSGAGERSR